jgi:hypothetical protein
LATVERLRSAAHDDRDDAARQHQHPALTREIIMANDKLDTLQHDAKDAADELKNRTQATGEHLKRDVAGDSMPLGDRIASNVKETLHNAKADVDATKRDVRHDADGDKV